MSKRLTNDQSKIDLVAKLVKEGAIDFNEAIQLLEVEVETKFVERSTMPNKTITDTVKVKWFNEASKWREKNPFEPQRLFTFTDKTKLFYGKP